MKFSIVERLKEKFISYSKNNELGIKSIIDIDGIRVHFENGWGCSVPATPNLYL